MIPENEFSPVETRHGDILKADDLDAIVNPVNCVGVMGKGLALQFAHRYPAILAPYRQACRNRRILPTKSQLIRISECGQPRCVANLATKLHWKNRSELRWADQGLNELYRQLAANQLASVGIPALGAGLGGLDWNKVEELIIKHAKQNPDIRTVIYAPNPNSNRDVIET